MAKETRSANVVTPPRTGETTPPAVPTLDYSFGLQAIMEMQKTLGGLSSDVRHLTDTVREHDRKVDRWEKIIYAAGVVLAIALVIGGWIVNTAKEIVIQKLNAPVTNPAPSKPTQN